ncbi:putative Zn-dependent peptidase [Anaerobacterium chartisolvens]|uniref:Putative Zn-dependent peptidase n=1 Tax=Anaerobacterium chartisolvens TaxID=1297424 RepID=A0A369AXH9_9FIRM|nr:pitrilysin family protein [Anaerobacterium chartisolvens]RCX13873.1 putative Zn-dependent peptidase [Anaerobacterium chartisolvens]
MFRKLTLENGVRVVCEKIDHVRSVSVGIWVGTGSRNESRENNGISHFIEHMLFKGTQRRSAKDIAESIDNIGGQLNAFTGKECTCYYTKTLDTHFEFALDVLSDMFFNSKFDKRDIDVERKVILEEIGMYEDSPEELVHDILSESVWEGNPLGYPILGVEQCLNGINEDSIRKYMLLNYTPSNVVISVAGNFDDDKLPDTINRYFGGWKSDVSKRAGYEKVQFINSVKSREKKTEQIHICMGFEGIEHGNDSLYTLLAINNILGGGMSSRLFQRIREEKGLVYSIYSYPSSYQKAGLFTIYAGMNPKHISKVIPLISEEISRLKKAGISEEELIKSKEQLKGNYILGLESTSSRMNSIGKAELMLGSINSPEEVLAKIDRVSMEDMWEVVERIFDISNVSFTAVGKLKKNIDLKKLI